MSNCRGILPKGGSWPEVSCPWGNLVRGDLVHGGILSMGYLVQGDIVHRGVLSMGDLIRRYFVHGGILSGRILSGGSCPGDLVRVHLGGSCRGGGGVLVLEPLFLL